MLYGRVGVVRVRDNTGSVGDFILIFSYSSTIFVAIKFHFTALKLELMKSISEMAARSQWKDAQRHPEMAGKYQTSGKSQTSGQSQTNGKQMAHEEIASASSVKNLTTAFAQMSKQSEPTS